MRLNLRNAVTLAALAGFLGAGLASPAAASDWGWRRHGWGGHAGWNNGGAAAAAAVGGFALGAAAGAASQPYYDAGQPYYGAGYVDDDDCYYVDRPVTDEWGAVVAYRRAQICD
jgi:hypothetical protein